MSSIILRSYTYLRSSWWSIRPGLTAQVQCRGPRLLPDVSSLQRNSRFVSATANAHYPRRSIGSGRRSKNEEGTTKRSQDVLTEVQDGLEKAALAVTEIDERISKELDHNVSFETYVKLTLSRLQPLLLYVVHRGSQEFLKGYAPPKSSVARARTAAVYLYISAHAWLFRAIAARSSGSLDVPPDVLKIAEQFNKTGIAVEAFVEDKLPEGMTWADVGGAILDSSSDAWIALSKIIIRETDAAAPDAQNSGDDRA